VRDVILRYRNILATLALAAALGGGGIAMSPAQAAVPLDEQRAAAQVVNDRATADAYVAPKPKPKPKPERKATVSRSVERANPVRLKRYEIRRLLVATAPAGTAAWEVSAGTCIASRESSGQVTVRNKAGSSATGLWQFLRGTWNGFKGYREARDAPPRVQAQKFWRLWDGGSGRGHWAGGQYPCW
jgi:hypothetical protein